MSEAETWLRAELPDIPANLLDTMLDAARRASGATIPAILANAACLLYDSAVRGTGNREDALILLAADALFTQAFQAQAELDPGGLDTFARDWADGVRLSLLLASAS